jgi:glyoxalase family protein
MEASGIHHVTAIAGPARRNLAFYTGALGLRLVKRTVNFDDPGTWHLYFGDGEGRPGTILTFFPWEQTAPGRLGAGQAVETGFRVPEASLEWWAQRLAGRGVAHRAPERRFGLSVLAFADPDGTALALVGVPGAEAEPAWSDGAIPAEHAIRGFHGVTLLLAEAGPTAAVLEDVLGFVPAGSESAVTRFRAPGTDRGGIVDLRVGAGLPPGRMGGGAIHHVAFRAMDDAAQAAMAERLRCRHGLGVTEQKDRCYFRSVYFREPGGVLFEIATDVPGFLVDEPAAALGRALKLPPFLEPRRRAIEAALPALE